jgi:hypothetical protein
MRSAPWLVSLLFVVACGGAPAREAAPASTSGAEEEESVQLDSAGASPEPMVVGWQSELNELERELDSDVQSLSTTIDASRCDDAGDLADRICELADRICGIAEDHPEASPRCDDAGDRCARSRERVADECG